MGVCFECRTGLDGREVVRTCLVAASDEGEALPFDGSPPMDADIAVVGGGPAGIAASVAASDAGRRVVVIDEAPAAGGNIWRGSPENRLPPAARRLIERFRRSGCRVLSGFSAVDLIPGFQILAASSTSSVRIRAGRVILATGARELLLPFPGWTLPGVVGVGGAQALLKSGFSFAGSAAVVAGTGPLLLAAAAALARGGARVVEIAEQADFASLARFGAALAASPGRLVDAIRYRAACRGARYRSGAWVVRAGGTERLESVTLRDGARERTVECDLLAAGFGLVPQTELARLAGCRISDGFVAVDSRCRTSVDGIYCAGEPTGIGGVDRSLLEGEIAGSAAADLPIERTRLRRRADRFSARLARAFRLREELRDLARPETIVCRCEDVPLARIRPCRSLREAKLATRAGMGPCQGRICGPALRFLFGWSGDSVRPPILPVPVGALVAPGDPPSGGERRVP